MSVGGALLLRATGLRAVRGGAALLLAATTVSTGFVALALPAHAGPVAPDITSPAPVVTSSDPAPQVTFSGPGAQYECAAAPATDPAPTYSDCASPWPVPILSPDGTYTLSVREKSLANDGTPATVQYTLDTAAQLTVTPPASPGRVARPTWTISTEPSSTVLCSLDKGTAVSCAGSYRPTTALSEGAHTLDVTATDALGNTATDSSTYVLDTTAPTAPTQVVGSSGTDNDTRPSWTWDNPDAATALCTLTGPGLVVKAVCPTPTSFTRVISQEGSYQLSVVLRDAAGNTTAPVAGPVYVLDTTPPGAASFTGGPTGTGTDPDVTWSFTGPAGATTTCALVGALAGTASTGSCSSPATYTLPADDTWKLVVTEDDGYGNTVSTPSATYTLDTTGPSAPKVTAPSGLSNDDTPHVTWTGELPSTAECRWQRTVGTVTTDGPWTPCDGRFFDPTLPGDGSYLFQARLTDPLGNLGATGTSGTPYVYDGTAPLPPTLTTPPTPGKDTTPTVTFTPEVPGGTAACTSYSGTTAPASPTWTNCTSGSFSPTLAADGTWTLAVTLADKAGNRSAPSTFTYVLDTQAPTAVDISGPKGPSSSRSPTWTLTADPADSLSCVLLVGNPPTTRTVGAATTCTTSFTADLTGAADGAYTVKVTATDSAGNTTVSTWPYTLDTKAPSSPKVSGPTGTGNAAAPTWTFPVQTGTTATCRLVQGLAMSAWSDCSGGSFTVTNPADGTYTVEVLVTDLAGNSAPIATSARYTSDRTAPKAPSVSGPTGPGNDPAPTWTWTGEAGVTATCRLDRAGVIGSPVACNSGTFRPALSGDTSYVVVVQLTDKAGNPSPATTTAAYLLDTSAPAAPVVSGPKGPSNVGSVTWSWTAESGAQATCTLVRDGKAGAPAACTSGTAWPLPGNGSFVLRVTVTDAAGNTSAVGSSPTYVYDATAPAAPVVTTPTSPSSDRSPDFAFTAESGTTAACQWLSGSTVVTAWTACSSPYQAALSTSPDGDYQLQVRVTDAAGNVSPVGSSLAYRLDTAAPKAPAVTMPSGPSTSTTPSITWTGEAGTTASCVLSLGGVPLPATGCSTPWQPTLTGDGLWTVSVTLTDQAGNTGPAGTGGPYQLDTTAPDAPVLTPPTSPGRTTTPVWRATLGTGDTAECQLTSGSRTLSAWSACAFPLTTDLTGEPDGSYTLSVRAVDVVGLVSGVVSATYELDSAAPAAPDVTAPASPSSSTSAQFSFTAEAGTTTTCVLTSGTRTISPAASCTSPLDVDLSAQPDGTYTLSVTATDQAGNPGAVGSASYALDRKAPAAPVITGQPASPAPSATPTWTFTAEAGATLTCTMTDPQGAAQSGSCTSPFTPTLSGDGTHTLSITATDAAGNVSAATTATYVLDTAAPEAPVLTAPASPSQRTDPSWQVQTPEGTAECQLALGSTVVVDWTSCTTGFSTTLTGSDGTYVLSARAHDAAGNVSAVATSSYVLDRAAPAAASLGAPASPGRSLQPSWTVTGSEPDLRATCSVAGPGGATSPTTCDAPTGGATFTADLSGLADGSYTLTVQVTDAAGNTASSTSTPYVLDTTAPSSVLVTGPQSPSPQRTVTWTLVGDDDATLECAFTGPGLPSPAFATCPASAGGQGSWTAALLTDADGTYVLTVRARDAADNVGPEVSSSYVLDTQAPDPPSGLTVDHLSPSNAARVTWSFKLPADSTGICQLLSATAVVTPKQSCASPWSTDLSTLDDATYTLSVRAVDAAGNVSTAVSRDYTVDRTRPAPPVVTKTPGSPSPVTKPVWNVEMSDPADALSCQLLGLPGSGWAPCSGTVTYDLAPATSGSYTLQVRETDIAGNSSDVVSAATYLLDSAVPVPPEVSPPAVSPDNDTAPVFTVARGQGDLGDAVTLLCSVDRFDGGPSVASPCAFGRVTVALTGITPRSQGSVTLTVQSRDAAGNTSGSASASYLYDGIPPDPAQIRPLASDVDTDPRVTWSFGAADTAPTTFRCQLSRAGGAPSIRLAGACRSPHTELLTQVGTWVLWVWAVDPAGNVSSPTSSRYTFLSRIPSITDLRGPTAGTTRSPAWTFSVPPGYGARCLLTGPSRGVLDEGSCSSGRYVGNLSRQPYGGYSLTVQLVDAQGTGGPYTTSSPYQLRAASAGPGVVHSGGGGGTTGGPVTPTGPHPVTKPVHGGSRPVPVPGAGAGRPHGTAHGTTTTSALRPTQPGSFITHEATKAIGKTLAQVAQKPTIPLVLLGVVVGFLLLQNRIDRRDPKLASAPVGVEPELDFGPVQGFEGGALA